MESVKAFASPCLSRHIFFLDPALLSHLCCLSQIHKRWVRVGGNLFSVGARDLQKLSQGY